MSIRCGVCGRFIGYGEDFITDFEPSSHFGPEVLDHVHSRCAMAEARELAIAAAARQSGDVQQAPGEAPQSVIAQKPTA